MPSSPLTSPYKTPGPNKQIRKTTSFLINAYCPRLQKLDRNKLVNPAISVPSDLLTVALLHGDNLKSVQRAPAGGGGGRGKQLKSYNAFTVPLPRICRGAMQCTLRHYRVMPSVGTDNSSILDLGNSFSCPSFNCCSVWGIAGGLEIPTRC
jgi:hypothetical protein